MDDGIAILDQGTSFGGGMLASYGINSNTSANSFFKCIFKKKQKTRESISLVSTVRQIVGSNGGANGLSLQSNNNNSGSTSNLRSSLANRKDLSYKSPISHPKQQSMPYGGAKSINGMTTPQPL